MLYAMDSLNYQRRKVKVAAAVDKDVGGNGDGPCVEVGCNLQKMWVTRILILVTE